MIAVTSYLHRLGQAMYPDIRAFPHCLNYFCLKKRFSIQNHTSFESKVLFYPLGKIIFPYWPRFEVSEKILQPPECILCVYYCNKEGNTTYICQICRKTKPKRKSWKANVQKCGGGG